VTGKLQQLYLALSVPVATVAIRVRAGGKSQMRIVGPPVRSFYRHNGSHRTRKIRQNNRRGQLLGKKLTYFILS
jgi:hypothetical protein